VLFFLQDKKTKTTERLMIAAINSIHHSSEEGGIVNLLLGKTAKPSLFMILQDLLVV
jgi:hypothetical protein